MDIGPRHAIVTPDDHGPLLAITTWFLGCTLVLCTATRLCIRLATRSPPTADDLFILAASALAVGETIAGSFAVESGLGKKVFLLTPGALENIQKEMYTATILYVVTIGLSKLSITTFLERLACTSVHRTSVVLLYGLIASWTFAFTTGVLFECKLPRPWAVFNGQCIPMLPFWITASLIDILTDLLMIFLPIRIVARLQLAPRKKAVVVCFFALRTLPIVLSITRIIFLDRLLRGDISFDGIPYGIASQAHATISVLVACLPGLKPFMDNVRTGMLSASLAKRGAGTTFGQDSWDAHTHDTLHSGDALWGSVSTSRARRSIRPVCPAEASIFVPDAPEKAPERAHRKPRVRPVCPAEASIFVVGPPEDSPSIAPNAISARSVCPAEASILTFDPHTHIVTRPRPRPSPRPGPVIPPLPAVHVSAPTRQASSGSLRRQIPQRPPPPPEELRPDLTCFQPRPLGKDNRTYDCEARKESAGDKEEGRVRTIKMKRRWEVRQEGGCI